MDINDLRAWLTLLMFAAFAGIVVWAWSGRNRKAFDEAAQLPFVGDNAEGGRHHE
jgi:cytochrome c oxidase cbb3-type subunit IV